MASGAGHLSLPIRLALIAIALAIAWLFVIFHAATTRLMFADLNMNDFGKFYYSSRQFLDGQDMYAPTPATLMPVGGGRYQQFLNMNPPHFHLLVLPLATLPPAQALAAWAVAGLAALLWSVLLIVRELQLRFTMLQGAWLLAAAMAFAGTGTLVITGQVSLVLLLIVTFAWLAARHGAWTRAGVWLGLLAGIKPFALIFLPWLVARRRWGASSAFVFAGAASFIAGIAIFGVEAHRSWLSAVQSTDWAWAAMNASLLGAIARWFGESPYFTPVMLAPWLITLSWLCTAGVAIALSILTAVRARGPLAIDVAFAVLLVGALLASPLGWVYYWWLPLGALVALVRQRRSPLFWLAVPGMFVPLLLVVAGQPSSLATFTVGSAYFWATLFVWVSLLGDRPSTAPAIGR